MIITRRPRQNASFNFLNLFSTLRSLNTSVTSIRCLRFKNLNHRKTIGYNREKMSVQLEPTKAYMKTSIVQQMLIHRKIKIYSFLYFTSYHNWFGQKVHSIQVFQKTLILEWYLSSAKRTSHAMYKLIAFDKRDCLLYNSYKHMSEQRSVLSFQQCYQLNKYILKRESFETVQVKFL